LVTDGVEAGEIERLVIGEEVIDDLESSSSSMSAQLHLTVSNLVAIL
jgi:hypothetical protein